MTKPYRCTSEVPLRFSELNPLGEKPSVHNPRYKSLYGLQLYNQDQDKWQEAEKSLKQFELSNKQRIFDWDELESQYEKENPYHFDHHANFFNWVRSKQSEPLTDEAIKKLAQKYFDDNYDTEPIHSTEGIGGIPDSYVEEVKNTFIAGFKANTSQGFSLEDIRKAMMKTKELMKDSLTFSPQINGWFLSFELDEKIADYIQSQSPKYKEGELYEIDESQLKEIQP